ncbi:hypothetical protein PRK78_001914 [Emydomyces testavorans]|uniref:Uncharacterized protein n=1 Tax=Emydomyces testavorans TaxID=2070801 RepID=A0AAF0IFZ0_9EURO|nr:hypothetical protein PRK78_001914 [Emydomyces testavorans]
MIRIELIYLAGTISTILSLSATVTNGVFAAAICRELPDMGGLQVASVTGCALSCIIQGFLVFSFRQRMKKSFRLKKRLERRMIVIIGILLSLTAVVVAMAISWSSTRLGDIRGPEQEMEVRRLFPLWCGLWGASILFQAICFGLFIYLSRKNRGKELEWEFSLTERQTTERLDEEKTGILRPSAEQCRSPQEHGTQRKPHSESSSVTNVRFSGLSKELAADSGESIKISTQTSNDSQAWVKSFSRRVPGLHDELVKLDTDSHQSKASSLRQSRDQSPDSLFERAILPESRSIRTPSPSLSIASSRRCVPPMQDNIHPLFRSDSPSVPPVASPGTTVTASPFAGHTISISALNQIRTQSPLSRPRSRSLLAHFEEEEEKNQDIDSNRMRRLSPLGQPPTYVLGSAAGSHTSLQDYGGRRGRTRNGRRGGSIPPSW